MVRGRAAVALLSGDIPACVLLAAMFVHGIVTVASAVNAGEPDDGDDDDDEEEDDEVGTRGEGSLSDLHNSDDDSVDLPSTARAGALRTRKLASRMTGRGHGDDGDVSGSGGEEKGGDMYGVESASASEVEEGDRGEACNDSDLDGLLRASTMRGEGALGSRNRKGNQGKGAVITEEGADAHKLGLAFKRVLGKATKQGVMEVCSPFSCQSFSAASQTLLALASSVGARIVCHPLYAHHGWHRMDMDARQNWESRAGIVQGSKVLQKRRREDEEESAAMKKAKAARRERKKRGHIKVQPKGCDTLRDAQEKGFARIATKCAPLLSLTSISCDTAAACLAIPAMGTS